MNENASDIQWGKVIAGAAIAAGAVAAFAFFAVDIQSTMVPALQSAMQETGNAIAIGWNWIGQNVIGAAATTIKEGGTEVITKGGETFIRMEADQVIPASGIVGFITENVGVAMAAAAAAGGLIASRMGSAAAASEKMAEGKSYALAEQLSRADALMQARMIANGYQPAMALAKNGPGRG